MTLQKADALLEGRVHRVVATGLNATQTREWACAIRYIAVSPTSRTENLITLTSITQYNHYEFLRLSNVKPDLQLTTRADRSRARYIYDYYKA